MRKRADAGPPFFLWRPALIPSDRTNPQGAAQCARFGWSPRSAQSAPRVRPRKWPCSATPGSASATTFLNNGQPDLEAKATSTVTGPIDGVETTREVATVLGGVDELRALSRVRFGVLMTGQSQGGVDFGATIRADNAPAGNGEAFDGQIAGNVFVTGDWGTLTFGDTVGADYHRTGLPIGNGSLTGLSDLNQLPFFSNGGGSDNGALQFVTDPEARPTVRYDYDATSFGVSVSTDRSLDDMAVGAQYTYRFDGGSIAVGGGYYDFGAFTGVTGAFGPVETPGGDQWAARSAPATPAFAPSRASPAWTRARSARSTCSASAAAPCWETCSSSPTTPPSPAATPCSATRSTGGTATVHRPPMTSAAARG